MVVRSKYWLLTRLRSVPQSRYRLNFLNALQFCYFVLVPFTLLGLSYFRIDASSSLFFKANDTQCQSKHEGIGIHCFGDFHEGLVSPTKAELFDLRNHYWLSPIDGIISRASTFLNLHLSERTILVAAFIIYLGAVLIPILDTRKNLKIRSNIGLITIIYIGSFPVLASLDRMNSICLVTPICYFFFSQLLGEKTKWITPLFVLMCSFKPQLLLLSIAIFIYLGLKTALKSLVCSIVGLAVVVVGQHSFRFSSLHEWIIQILEYGSNGLRLSDDYPNNISFSRALYYISIRIGITSKSEGTYILISVLVSLVLLGLTLMMKKWIENPEIVFIILTISILGFSKVTYPYYLILLLVFELARFRENSGSVFSVKISNTKQPFRIHARKILFIVMLVPIPVPVIGYIRSLNIQEYSQSIIPILNPILISIAIFTTNLAIVQHSLREYQRTK